MSESSHKLDNIFYPKSIAVVGASTRPGTVGNDIFRNLLYANFQRRRVSGQSEGEGCLGREGLSHLVRHSRSGGSCDLIVPASAILGRGRRSDRQGREGPRGNFGGFKEVGKEGAELEVKLREKVRKAGIPLIGPNCLGVINTDPELRMNGTFGRKMPADGSIAFLSQSGALCCSVLDYAEDRQVGFSKFVSMGNKGDVSECDLLEYLADDPKTKVITMYLEDVAMDSDSSKRPAISSGAHRKPILCLTVGPFAPKAPRPSAAITGSLAGSDSVYDALMKQAGVQRVDTISELFDFAVLYSTQTVAKG